MNNVEHLVSNSEEFVKGTYNGISVLIRKNDGFINATKLCNQFNKKFRKIFENLTWQAYFQEFCKEYEVRPNSGEPLYELKKGISNDFKGTYIDPRLINYIAIWASPKYAVYVGKIMDLINERNQIDKKSLDDTINEMKQQLEEAKMKIYNLEQEVEKKNIDLFESSVRVDENIRDLYIIEVEDQYKLCADSSNRPPNVIKHFIFQRA